MIEMHSISLGIAVFKINIFNLNGVSSEQIHSSLSTSSRPRMYQYSRNKDYHWTSFRRCCRPQPPTLLALLCGRSDDRLLGVLEPCDQRQPIMSSVSQGKSFTIETSSSALVICMKAYTIICSNFS